MTPVDALFLALGVLLLFFVGVASHVDRQRQDDLQRAMDGVLTRRGQGTVDRLAEMVDDQKYILGRHHGTAQAVLQDGRYEAAAARMALGCTAIEELAPDFLTAVRALHNLTRAVSVIASASPVRADAFRVRGLRGIAGAGHVLHHLLLTGRQQIRLRLGVVLTVFRLALRDLRGTTARATRRPADLPTWKRIDALVTDLGTAGDEAVVAARQIVQALDAVDLGIPARHHAGL